MSYPGTPGPGDPDHPGPPLTLCRALVEERRRLPGLDPAREIAYLWGLLADAEAEIRRLRRLLGLSC